LILAKYHNDNEKIGQGLKQKKSDVEKFEVEITDLRNTFDNLHTLEKEKKEVIIVLHESKKEIM
jgi:Fe-S-cluster formation regulator IscX/YfhJ